MCQLAGLILCLSGAVLVAPSELLPNPGFEARAAGEDLPDSWTVIEGHVGLTTQTVHSFLNPVQVADASSAKAAAWGGDARRSDRAQRRQWRRGAIVSRAWFFRNEWS